MEILATDVILRRKFKLTFEMKEVGTYDSPKDAFREVYNRLTAMKSIPTVVFETIWVDVDPPRFPNLPISFYELRDHAADMGWVVDGKWVERRTT
jgi:hypothetical protein